MEVTFTLDYGPVHAEISGEDWETIEPEVREVAAFLDLQDELGDGGVGDLTQTAEDRQPDLQSGPWTETGEVRQSGAEPTEEKQSEPDGPLRPLVSELDASLSDVEDVVYADDSDDEGPHIITSKSNLGDSKTKRQRNAAYFLLLVWEYCYGEERVKTSELKSALDSKGISDTNLYNIWSSGEYGGHFDRSGRGPSSTVALTGPGEIEAKSRLDSLATTGEISDE